MNLYPILWRKVGSARVRASIGFWRVVNWTRLSLHPGVSVGPGLEVTGSVVWKIHPQGRLVLGHGVRVHSGHLCNALGGHRRTIVTVLPGGNLIIGDGAGFSSSTIICQQRIEIGRQVRIGGGCTIVDTDFHSLRLDERLQPGNPGVKSKPIKIGDGAFIGGGVWVLKGVTIGLEAVVGAASLVSRDIPAGEIWAGNPVRFIGKVG